MKRLTHFFLPVFLFTMLLCFLNIHSLKAQPSSPPPGLNSSGHSSNGAEKAPSAPLGSGFSIFLVMGAVYLAHKKLKTTEKD
jgi:hypothetical protein